MLGADHRRVTARGRRVPHQVPPRQGARKPCLASATAAALLGLAVAGLGGEGAVAAEWLAGGSVSQRLQFQTNRDLSEDGGPLYGTTTALGLDFTALAPRTQWQFETGASFGLYGGDSDDTDELGGLYPNFGAAVSHNGKYIDTGASFGFDLQPAAFAQLDETGVTEGDAIQLSIRLAADAAMAIDPRNQLSLGVSGRIIRFTSGTTSLEPYTSYGTNLSWGHSLSPDTRTSVGVGVNRFTSKGADDQESLSFSLSGGIGHAINQRLSVDAGLGLTATNTTRTLFGLQQSDFSVGPRGDLSLSWRLQSDTQLVFAFSHGLEPSSFGDLQTTTALGVGLQHSVNSWISGGVDLLLQRQSAASDFGDDTTRTSASLSPSLALRLTRDVTLRLSYALRMQEESGFGTFFSNGAFLTLTRAFDILP